MWSPSAHTSKVLRRVTRVTLVENGIIFCHICKVFMGGWSHPRRSWSHLQLQKDRLTDHMKPGRVKTTQHVIDIIAATAAFNFVGIEPCFSMFLQQQAKADLLKVVAIGNRKRTSTKCKRKGANLRAPKTAKTQQNVVTMARFAIKCKKRDQHHRSE